MNVLKITSDNRLKFSPCKIFDAFAAAFALFLRTTTSSNISSYFMHLYTRFKACGKSPKLQILFMNFHL